MKRKHLRRRNTEHRSSQGLFEVLALEPRRLLSATLHWKTGGDEVLEHANNWVENQVPAAGDDLIIGVSAGIDLGANSPQYGSISVGNSTGPIAVTLNLGTNDLNTDVLFVAPGVSNAQLTLMDGNVYVTGAPSWIGDGCTGDLYLDHVYANFSEINIGANPGGEGSLEIDDDSQAVIDGDLNIGDAGSIGSVTVTGGGLEADWIAVGDENQGVLTVEGGGYATVTDSVIVTKKPKGS